MKEPYTLPDEDCERLKRTEMDAVRMLLAVGSLRSVVNDLIGTISRSQCKQINGTMKDFEMRLVPKLTPASVNVILTKEQGMDLVDCAQWQCRSCVKDGEEARKCKLYQILESTTPLDDYGDGFVCPYALAEWSE